MAFRGRITLWKALLNENVAEAVRLLEGGADATELHDGKTPMQFFAENKKVAKPELFDAFLKFGAVAVVDDTCLYRACFKDNVNAVRIFLQAKKDGRVHFNVNIIHPARNDTPLFVAVRNENPAICQLLLNDPDVDPNIRVEAGFTALYYAVSENLFDIVDLFLQNPRTDPNIQFQDKTPLHVAAVKNNARIISMLVLHPRIDPYIRDRFEATALDIAKVRRNKDTIALLERFPAAPLPTPPLTTALIVHNYATMPNATNLLERERIRPPPASVLRQRSPSACWWQLRGIET
jgi:ankyrin repeat protein